MNIAAHHDADGVSATVLYLKSAEMEIDEVNLSFPDTFGEYNEDTDMMVDMTPTDGEYSGFCIDHHNQHLPSEEREYELLMSRYPTCVAVYHNYPVPKTESWKVAVGATGDASPEMIPGEVFLEHPQLRDYHASVWQDWDTFSLKTNPVQAYKLISSNINAMCKVGKPERAFVKLFNSEGVSDVLYDNEFLDARSKTKSEVKKTIKGIGKKGAHKIYQWQDIMLVRFSSDYRIGGEIASKLHDSQEKTIVVINMLRKKGSIRGNLTNMLNVYLNREGFHVGGHGGACGISLNDKTVDDLVKSLRKV